MLQFSKPALLNCQMAAQIISGAETPLLIPWGYSFGRAIVGEKTVLGLLFAEASTLLHRANCWTPRVAEVEIKKQLRNVVAGLNGLWPQISEKRNGGSVDLDFIRQQELAPLREAIVARLREMSQEESLAVQLFLGVPIFEGGLSTFFIGERSFSKLFGLEKTKARGLAHGAVNSLAAGLRNDLPDWAPELTMDRKILLIQAALHTDPTVASQSIYKAVTDFINAKATATNRQLLGHTLLVAGISLEEAEAILKNYDDDRGRAAIRTLLHNLSLLS